MVDVTQKRATDRAAWAGGALDCSPAAFAALKALALKKGDALVAAQVAGIQAAKSAHLWIPLCHPIRLTHVDVTYAWEARRNRVRWTVACRAKDATGCEMEALTGAAAVGLTLHDMIKAMDPWCVMHDVRLLRKTGGKAGDQRSERWIREPKNTSGR